MVTCQSRNAALAIRARISLVMPGLDPGIHPLQKSWIAGSGPAMTDKTTFEATSHGDP
jgi:hypothetical protein